MFPRLAVLFKLVNTRVFYFDFLTIWYVVIVTTSDTQKVLLSRSTERLRPISTLNCPCCHRATACPAAETYIKILAQS